MLLCLLSALPPGAAQGQPSEPFADRIDVEVVNLDVAVVDRDGNPVTGLAKSEFVVWVDDEEVPIAFFDESRAVPADDATADESPAETAGADTGMDAGVSFLVFIDDAMTLERNRDFVLERLRGELTELGPRDQMAVVSYDGDRLHELTSWTRSRERLERAFAEATDRTSAGIKYIALRRMPNYIANWEGRATRRTVVAAAAALQTLPVPPGRKVLLLVAGSWDPREVDTAGNFLDWCQAGPCVGPLIFRALTDTANELGYSIYTIDVEGRDPNLNWPREKRIQELLADIAGETGGRHLLNTRRRQALSIASSDSRNYYSLGVNAADVEAGRRHHLWVEVRDRPDLTVRAKGSFVALSEERQNELAILNSMLLGSETEPSFRVEFGASRRVGLDRLETETRIWVPWRELVWIEGREGSSAGCEIQLVVLDPQGRSSEVGAHTVTIDDRSALREPVRFEILTRLRTKNLGVRIRDLYGDGVHFGVVRLPRHRKTEESQDAAVAPAPDRSDREAAARSL